MNLKDKDDKKYQRFWKNIAKDKMYVEASDRTIYSAEKGNLHILAQDNNSGLFLLLHS